MSLATRCPACGTIFRVVQDQLKVSEGWVRCGQCNEVFHGVESLFDIDREPGRAARRDPPVPATPPTSDLGSSSAPTPPPAPGEPAAPSAPADVPVADPATARSANIDEVAESAPPAPPPPPAYDPVAWLSAPPPKAADAEPAVSEDDGEASDGAPSRQPRTISVATLLFDRDASAPGSPGRPAPPAPIPARPTMPPVATETSLLSDSSLDASDTRGPARGRDAGPPLAAPSRTMSLLSRYPRFVREAQESLRGTDPRRRIATLGAVVLLAALALLQAAYPFRDALAARWPATAGTWQAVCGLTGCKLEAPRELANLALDGSSLIRTDADYVLLFSADLHNRADHPVRMPSFDLAFLDLNGAIVARKVLGPDQIGLRPGPLAAQADLHVHARLDVGALDASGFQAEMFYP